VISVRVSELWAAPIVRHLRALGTVDRLTENRLGGRLRDQLGFDPEHDVDRVRLIWGAQGSAPLCWALGRFTGDPKNPNPAGLRVLDAERHAPFTLFLSDNGGGDQVTFATDGHALVGGRDPRRVADVLPEVRGGRQPPLRNDRFKGLFRRVDQDQTVWFVADRGLPHPTPMITDDINEDLFLSPFFNFAESMYGGIRFKDDAEAMVHVETGDGIRAAQFERALETLKDDARRAADLTTTRAWVRPLWRCVAGAEVVRDGTRFTVRFKLTPDMAL
jgi:hypothetical protein